MQTAQKDLHDHFTAAATVIIVDDQNRSDILDLVPRRFQWQARFIVNRSQTKFTIRPPVSNLHISPTWLGPIRPRVGSGSVDHSGKGFRAAQLSRRMKRTGDRN